jgi:hypothetical protein
VATSSGASRIASHRALRPGARERTIVIADGHHRYETALAYRDEQRGNEAAGYVLAYLANMEEEGVVILPTHRLVRGAMRPAADARRRRAVVRGRAAGRRTPGGRSTSSMPDTTIGSACVPARRRVGHLAPAVRRLDLAVLHELVLGRVLGLRVEDLDHARRRRRGGAGAERRGQRRLPAERPTIGQVRDVCFAGELMPEKSTYFFPKLASGLVFLLVGPPWV